jgi:hypothetical protein
MNQPWAEDYTLASGPAPPDSVPMNDFLPSPVVPAYGKLSKDPIVAPVFSTSQKNVKGVELDNIIYAVI